jgi:hypothetical protein
MKFSLRTLLLTITVAAIACFGLFDKSAGRWGVMTVCTLGFTTLIIFTIAAVFLRGRPRAFAGGFAIAAWIYFLMSFLWLLVGNELDDLTLWPTARLLNLIVPREKIVQTMNGATVVSQGPHPDALFVGQFLWAILIGIAGGFVGRWCYLAGQRVEQRQMLANAQTESLRSGER